MNIEKSLEMNDHQNSPLYASDERFVLELANAMTSTPARISDDLRATSRSTFRPSRADRTCGHHRLGNYLARTNRVFRVESEGFYKS